jgi:rubrerythrin
MASVWKLAKDMEKQAVRYYSGMMKKADAFQKAALSVIIDEEQKPVVLMEALIGFARTPQAWLENAEFNYLDEY